MQPWNFVLITSPQLRTQIKVLFEEINEGEAHQVAVIAPTALSQSQARRAAGISDEPGRYLRPATGKPFVLGRAPVPDTDIYSTCLAIQNMWLAACAEGIGIGWVSILDYGKVERSIGVA